MSESLILALVAAICHVESGHNPKAINIHDGDSPSYGECQVKLKTARWLGFKGRITDLWTNSKINREWAGNYLRYQLKRYKGDVRKAVSAYNCGSVCKNDRYVREVMMKYREYEWAIN
jgi:soluble lytic murein transglycosylase-like protein